MALRLSIGSIDTNNSIEKSRQVVYNKFLWFESYYKQRLLDWFIFAIIMLFSLPKKDFVLIELL